jgi:glycosyltransferase involved in cell wall biosynthesis
MTDIGGSAVEASKSGASGPDLPGVAGLRVLRLCSVFEPATLSEDAARYDAIGGMQNHTAELSRCLDRMGVRQLVLTSRLDGPPGRAGLGRYGQVVRTGLRTPLVRQAWAPQAAWLALGDRGLVSLVHAHCGEDIAVLPLARLAAWRHGCPLAVTIHASVRHTMRVTSARTALLRLAGGLAESRALSRVLVEGMAAGLPVVASRVGGIPALVEHEVNGLLVPPGDAAALAAAITRVLTEPGTAARLSAAARRTAAGYAWPTLAGRVAMVYQEVTARA